MKSHPWGRRTIPHTINGKPEMSLEVTRRTVTATGPLKRLLLVWVSPNCFLFGNINWPCQVEMAIEGNQGKGFFFLWI